MSIRRFVCLGCAALMLGPHGGRADEAPSKSDPTAKERLQLARDIYRELADQTVQELMTPPDPNLNPEEGLASILSAGRADEFSQWSRRWMEAERDTNSDGAGTVAALKGHLARMRSLERGQLLKDWLKNKGQTITDEKAAEDLKAFTAFARRLTFYRLEAESWLSKETEGASQDAKPINDGSMARTPISGDPSHTPPALAPDPAGTWRAEATWT